MGDVNVSFSRSELLELKQNFNSNLEKTLETLMLIKKDFENIKSKWQGGYGEVAVNEFEKVSKSFDIISADLNAANNYIAHQADGFEELKFH